MSNGLNDNNSNNLDYYNQDNIENLEYIEQEMKKTGTLKNSQSNYWVKQNKYNSKNHLSNEQEQKKDSFYEF